MGVVNTFIRFAENTHKYGPFVTKRILYPIIPPVLRLTSNPFTLAFLLVLGLPILLASFAGNATIVLTDPFGVPILPFDVLGLGF